MKSVTKGFTDKSNLTEHMRTHTGGTPYARDICLKQIKSWRGFTEHRRGLDEGNY